MITALPMKEDRFSGHFSRAESLLLCNERGETLGCHHNPAFDRGCNAKQALRDFLVQQNVSRVMVRNIGQQMLGRLLSWGIAVFKIQGGHVTFDELFNPETTILIPLTDTDQGRVSQNHERKRKEGSCCTHSCHEEPDAGHRRDGAHEKERCCQRAHAQHPGSGNHGRCC